MTQSEFRKLALSYPAAEEASHFDHPDFRVRGRIFATLGYPDDEHGILMLSPEEQKELVARHPAIFASAPGAWGRRGNTGVLLPAAKEKEIRHAMTAAWRRVAPKRLHEQLPGASSA